MISLPLEGIRVLEVGSVFVLPLAITPLADMGAEVIKLEATIRPDQTRWLPQPGNIHGERAWNHGGRFHDLNRNKLGLTLNLMEPQAKRIFMDLVKLCDVVAENFTPRVMKNFGLDYVSLQEVNPEIIVLSSSGFGHSGPWANYAAWGPITEAVAGLMHITGYPDGEPLRLGAGGLGGVAYNDVVGAYFGAYAVLGALDYRDRTGKGQWIDLSHYEAGATIIGEALMDYMVTGNVEGRNGNQHEYMAPHGCYRCQGDDEWIAISVSDDEEWASMRKALGYPAWTAEERFATMIGRWKNQSELDHLVEEWTRQHERHEAMSMLQEAGVAAGAVLSSKEVLTDPHLSARGAFQWLSHTEEAGKLGAFRHLGPWWQTSQAPPRRLEAAPALGQHNNYVLSELLGLPNEAIRQMEEAGIIGTAPAGRAAGESGTMPLSTFLQTRRLKEVDPDFRRILGESS